MSNILIISAVFPPEPVVSAMLSSDIAEGLSKQNSIVVLCPPPSRPEGFKFESIIHQLANYKVIHLNSFVSPEPKIFNRLRESYSFGKYSARYITKNSREIDCIYLNSWPFASQYLIIKAAKKSGIPAVIHIQDIYPESLILKLPKVFHNFLLRLLMPIDKYILKNATKIICISENMISYLSVKRKIKIDKFELVRNWQDDDKFLNFRSLENQSDFTFTFMYVGSISFSAGVEQLIYAFKKANLQKSKLIIIGNGAQKRNCEELASRLNIVEIEFLEVVPEKVPEIQSNADVLLLPLRKDISKTATPSKLVAYLFSGKPVIACVEPGSDVANILNNANCGIVVEPENIKAVAEAMKMIYQLPEMELKKMGKNGMEYAINNLSKKRNLDKITSLIENVIRCK